MKKMAFFCCLGLLSIQLRAQELISSRLLGSRTAAQIQAQFSLPLTPPNGAKFYRITYTMPDLKGVRDTASGLLVLPDAPNRKFPRLVYQHGTSDSKQAVPSNTATNGEGSIGLIFGGFGYVTILPDYLGMGTSRGFHPYIHAQSEADAAIYMLRATRAFAAQNGAPTNDQLFVTGYSQGGHAAMALHQAIEVKHASEFTVTAAAHLSGPYSISNVMRTLMVDDAREYLYVAYLPNTALSYQTVYGNLYKKLSDMFKPEYVQAIQDYYDQKITLSQLNVQLVATLRSTTGKSIGRRMLQDSIVKAVIENPNHPISRALRDNDTYRWTTKTPTRLFYCMGDDQVPFQNSLLARDSMLARGATSLQIQDLNPAFNHGQCVSPALLNTLIFFSAYQKIDIDVSVTQDFKSLGVAFGPNPVQGTLHLMHLPVHSRVLLYDLRGQLVWQESYVTGGDVRISTGHLPNGFYVMQLNARGQTASTKIVVSNPH